MRFNYDDGGRQSAGFKGTAGDCVTRAIAIALRVPYRQVYADLKSLAKLERPRKGRKRSSVRDGVSKRTIRRYLGLRGWQWVPTMQIGSGCRVHLRDGDLPHGRLIVSVSRHMCAVIDGVIHDTTDPSRGGTRCVYGYYIKPLKQGGG